MPYYESVVIARQDLSAQQVEQLTDELVEVIKAGGGEIAKRESWGLRNLAYKIKKNRKDILRYLTVRVKELDPEPSAVLQNRGGRDDRRGPRGDRGDRGDRGPRGDRGGDRGPRRDRDERPDNRAGE